MMVSSPHNFSSRKSPNHRYHVEKEVTRNNLRDEAGCNNLHGAMGNNNLHYGTGISKEVLRIIFIAI